MRKLRVFESISVDGYFTDGNGDMSWAHAAGDDLEFAEWVSANASSGASNRGASSTTLAPSCATSGAKRQN